MDELQSNLVKAVLSEINSAIESFISTDLIPFLLKQSHGDLKALSQKYALEVRSGLEEKWRGQSCCFKFTIALFSKSLNIGRDRVRLSISLDELWKMPCLTPTPSSSNGE